MSNFTYFCLLRVLPRNNIWLKSNLNLRYLPQTFHCSPVPWESTEADTTLLTTNLIGWNLRAVTAEALASEQLHGKAGTASLTCELALLQEALEEWRVREEHLLETLSTHVEDGVDEETAREVGKQGGQITWETKGSSLCGYTSPFPWADCPSSGLQGGRVNSSS